MSNLIAKYSNACYRTGARHFKKNLMLLDMAKDAYSLIDQESSSNVDLGIGDFEITPSMISTVMDIFTNKYLAAFDLISQEIKDSLAKGAGRSIDISVGDSGNDIKGFAVDYAIPLVVQLNYMLSLSTQKQLLYSMIDFGDDDTVIIDDGRINDTQITIKDVKNYATALSSFNAIYDSLASTEKDTLNKINGFNGINGI